MSRHNFSEEYKNYNYMCVEKGIEDKIFFIDRYGGLGRTRRRCYEEPEMVAFHINHYKLVACRSSGLPCLGAYQS